MEEPDKLAELAPGEGRPKMDPGFSFSAKPIHILIYGLYGVLCLCSWVRFTNRRLAKPLDTEVVRGCQTGLLIAAASIMLFGFIITGSHLLVAATVIGTTI